VRLLCVQRFLRGARPLSGARHSKGSLISLVARGGRRTSSRYMLEIGTKSQLHPTAAIHYSALGLIDQSLD